MSRMPCRACRTCAGNALRELQGDGWYLSADGIWRKKISQATGALLANDIAAGRSRQRIEVSTDATGSSYVLLLGEP